MSIVNALAKAQAPLGAAYRPERPLMPLLTELNLASAGGPHYRHAAPNGAGRRVGSRASCEVQRGTPALQDLAAFGSVSECAPASWMSKIVATAITLLVLGLWSLSLWSVVPGP